MEKIKKSLSDFLVILLILFCINFITFLLIGSKDFIALALLLSLNEIILILIFYEIIETIIKKKKYKKINYEGLENFKYFREILKKHAISELGMIYNNSINSDILISLEIKHLIKKGKIKIEGNKVFILNKEDLNSFQLYILNSLKFIDLPKVRTELKKKLKKNLIEQEIFVSLDNEVNMITVFICIMLFFVAFSKTLSSESILMIYGILSFVVFWFELVILMFIFSKYSINLRTKKGQEIYLKMFGLKNYLKDFSNFDEKQLKDISLWDEYILYAVILDEGKKIENEILELFVELSKNAKLGNLEIIDYTIKN